jgi:hypothetical protein
MGKYAIAVLDKLVLCLLHAVKIIYSNVEHKIKTAAWNELRGWAIRSLILALP